MAKRFTPEQERILNEWARTASELRRAFPYTSSSNTQTQGLGYHLNKDLDPGRFYIEVRQSDGLQGLETTSILSFNADSFYLNETSVPGEIMVNFRGSTGGGSSITLPLDHGTDLIGLGDDDHPQYLLIDGTRAMTGDLLMGGKDVLNAAAGLFSDKIVAEAFYLQSAGNLYSDESGNTILDVDGKYFKVVESVVIGNPGTEDDGISLDGTIFDSVLKVTEIGTTNIASLTLHRHSQILPISIITTRSRGETATHSDVVNDDSLFFLSVAGRNSGTYEVASQLDFRVEGTPVAGALPGKIDFRTNDGSDTGLLPKLAMTIHSDQHVSMENTLAVDNAVTAEAFYMRSNGDLSAITRNITLQYPSRRDTIDFFSAEADFRVTKMRAILRTNDSGFYPSVNFTLRHGAAFPSRGSGTELETEGWQCGFYPGHPYLTADKNPLVVTTFDSSTILKDSYVWLETTKLGEGNGVEEELAISLWIER